ncbi:hypothetical protein [Microtetraspora malaysiensis]|uniref:hypothetical protein n=1 Tax=Microtetraspora malaysiensis TaxID=161358 RepID=UPI003D91B129
MSEPQLIVEIAFPVGASTSTYLQLDDTARGRLDTGTLAGDTTWVDVSQWVRAVSTRRGASRTRTPILRFEPGTCTITLDNSDRRFDPTNMGGPYVGAGRTQVTPMRAVRIRAAWNGTTYNLFRGYADSWDITWWDPNDAEAVVQCTDAFKVLANYDRTPVTPIGDGELSGARVNRILDSVSWPPVDRLIDTGDTVLQATKLEGDALGELQLTADSDLGELYVDGSGRIVFRGRFGVTTDDRSNTPQAVFGDAGDGIELPYNRDGLAISYDDEQLINVARIGRAGGTVQTVEDAGSQAQYMVRTFERTDLLMASDEDAASVATWIISISKEPELRFDAITVSPDLDPDRMYPHVLGREIGDRITIIRRPPGGGAPIERDVWIRGITHESRPGHWRTTWSLQSASKTLYFLKLDNPVTGQLDNYALA